MGMGLPIHVAEVPDYEIQGDCMRVTWRELEFFIPIPVCQAAMARCARAMDEWYEGKGVVLPFRQPSATE